MSPEHLTALRSLMAKQETQEAREALLGRVLTAVEKSRGNVGRLPTRHTSKKTTDTRLEKYLAKLREYGAQGLTSHQIAQKVGKNARTVRQHCYEHNIEYRKFTIEDMVKEREKNRYTPEEYQERVESVRSRLKEGMTVHQTAKDLRMGSATVRRICRDNDIRLHGTVLGK